MKKFIIKFAIKLGQMSNFLMPDFFATKINNLFHFFFSGRFYGQVSSCGFPLELRFPIYLSGGKYIKIGNNFHASYRFRIEAWDQYKGKNYSPVILIGDNVSFSDNCHVGAINLVSIGNNVLFGSNVYITDHFHGDSGAADNTIHPLERCLVSKGAVIIEDDVWVGDGVSIMPNVTIGRACIVGANSVVTKSFPPKSVIAGCPAKLIKLIN